MLINLIENELKYRVVSYLFKLECDFKKKKINDSQKIGCPLNNNNNNDLLENQLQILTDVSDFCLF